MNIDRINALADLIEQQPHTSIHAMDGFNMSGWTHTCGTPSCIAGWARHMSGQTEPSAWTIGEEWLGLTETQSDELFLMTDSDISFEDVTPAHAAAVLRHLAATGTVDWSIQP